MWQIATSCGLDPNSPYKYLLFCRDFADTSAIVRVGGEPAGFVTGYRRPGTDALFVWQIGVLDTFQKRGLARAMLEDLARRMRPRCSYLEATVTPDNVGSRRLFEGLARRLGARFAEEELFGAELFPEPHDPERLFRIGPIADDAIAGLSTTTDHAEGIA